MVVCAGVDHYYPADVIFVIEATAVSGAYINDIKTNYIIPTLEYFSQGNLDENNHLIESLNSFYGIVLYQAADCLPRLSTDTIGPFSSPGKVVTAIDKLELYGGKGEFHANIAEGLASALQCFEELQLKREPNSNVQKHCLLVCTSPPYALPVLECHAYTGKTAEQLAMIMSEHNINLSILSSRKLPSLYKLFEKAGGDLTVSQNKNYAKDPRHLVLLKGYSLKERPISPPPGSVSSQQNVANTNLPIPSLPSPLAGNDSPIQGSSQNTQNVQAGVGQAPVYRPPSAGLNTIPQHSQSIVSPNMVGIVNPRGPMMPGIVSNIMSGSPGYNTHVQGMGAQRPPQRWGMPPQPNPQRPYMPPNQQTQQAQSSALITQLTRPPSAISSSGVNQFIQLNNSSPLSQLQQTSQQQQQQIKLGMNIPNQMQNSMGQGQNIQDVSAMSQVSQPNQVVTSQAQNVSQPGQQQAVQVGPGRERHTIWQGLLEWIEKPKSVQDQQKITKHVPCQVSANSKDGEPELKADGWPAKLIMQLMPKQLIGTIGGAYLKNSKSVLFHPQPCEALESLTKVMSSGFAGCVHFTSVANSQTCDIKVLILLYTAEKRAYLGFIPNDQTAFVGRLREVIQKQKSSQQILRQTQGGAAPGMNPQSGSPLSVGGASNQMIPNPTTSQPGQGLMIQTNPIAMGGGQITQNVVSSSGQPNVPFKNVLGQNVPGGGMQPRLGLTNMQQGMNQSPQPGSSNNMSPGMMGAPVQRAACENQLQAERQHNLEKINQLKQTLEAAQQQEQQYKSQLERISHMKTTQLQEALQVAQQTEMQYKMLDQQRMANQANQQANNPQQQNQRMMRPVMSNNPGLRHLLQQQPQYRQQQIIGMQQQMPGNGARPPPQMGQQLNNQGGGQNTFDDVTNFDFIV